VSGEGRKKTPWSGGQIFERNTAASANRRSGFGDPIEEFGVILQAIVEPVFLGFEPDQDSGGLPVSKKAGALGKRKSPPASGGLRRFVY